MKNYISEVNEISKEDLKAACDYFDYIIKDIKKEQVEKVVDMVVDTISLSDLKNYAGIAIRAYYNTMSLKEVNNEIERIKEKIRRMDYD